MVIESIRGRVKSDLQAAVQARQQTPVEVLRTLLASIENAEAVPLEEANRQALDPTRDVPRRQLSEAQILAILQDEADERKRAIATYETMGRQDVVAQLRVERNIIAGYLALSDSQ
jgi:uncharacterized protein